MTLSSGITLKGLMHEQLNVSYDKAASDSDIYNAFNSALPNKKMTVYTVSCDDGNGGFIPEDYWCSGVSISVPVDSNDVTFAVLGSDGTVRLVEPESIENGIATFPAASPVSFAVVSTASAEPGDNNSSEPGNSNVDPRTDGNNSGSDQYSGNGNVQTGEAPTALMAFVMMLISAAAVVFMRRKKNRE
jgi:LPXTG-motif cell wall-anchored protein